MSAFDKQSPVGFRRRVTVCVSACRCQNQETWEEMILDDGAYCDASQVRVPRL